MILPDIHQGTQHNAEEDPALSRESSGEEHAGLSRGLLPGKRQLLAAMDRKGRRSVQDCRGFEGVQGLLRLLVGGQRAGKKIYK